ncbi:MAG: SDR family oxidoreductase [Anaerolineales bacterium]
MPSSSQTLLVTGASGHLGRRVVELLLEADAGPIIATTRTPEKLADLAAKGVEVRFADFDQPESLAAAFAGADRLFLVSTDMLMVPGHRLVQHRAAVDAAVQAGVQHVLYTSLIRPEPGTPISLAPDHYGTEQALVNSPLDWTFLRNNVYTDGFLMSLPQAIARGSLVAATGEGGAAYITREDCARAAAAALASSTTGRYILNITGPDVVTHAELAAIASEISGKKVDYVSLPAQELTNLLSGTGLPQPVVDLIVSFDTAVAQGFLDEVSSTVTDLTGRPPQSVRDFLFAHRDALLGANG